MAPKKLPKLWSSSCQFCLQYTSDGQGPGWFVGNFVNVNTILCCLSLKLVMQLTQHEKPQFHLDMIVLWKVPGLQQSCKGFISCNQLWCRKNICLL